MDGNVYLLLTGSNQLSADTIYSRNTDLKIKVYNLALMGFTANADEIQLYAYRNNELLAFETVGITADEAMEMVVAIKWYARYVENPKMEILPEDPRVEHENEIAV